jgi:hypothetical protein
MGMINTFVPSGMDKGLGNWILPFLTTAKRDVSIIISLVLLHCSIFVNFS